MQNGYIMSVNQAMNYIFQNLDKTMTVEEIAEHCCFSKYYFNRVFKLMVGENIYSFIKRIKLESAAFKLRAAKNRTITEIAFEAGYSPSNFASAFKEYFGISASAYRKEHDVPYKDSFAKVTEHIYDLRKKEDIFAEIDAKIHIKRIAGMNLVYRRVICNYRRDLEEEWQLFRQEMEHKYGLNSEPNFVGISYDDPLITNEDRCIYDMCLKVDDASGCNVRLIESGLYACYSFYDILDKIVLAFNEIFALWLPFCKYKLDNRLGLEVYQSDIDEYGNIRLEICIPIQDC